MKQVLNKLVLRCVIALSVMTMGCRTFLWIPEPERKTVDELFFEAVHQAYPETRLGLQEQVHPEYVNAMPAAGMHVAPLVPPIPVGEPVPESYLPPAIDSIAPPPLPPADGLQNYVEPATFSTVTPAQFENEQVEEQLVSDFFEQTDVRQAIQSLATQADISIIMDDQVAGVVSVVIESEPFEMALQKVLLPLGMIYHIREDGTYLIGLPDPTTALFPLIAEQGEYRPYYIAPEDLVTTLPERWADFVRVVENRNLILIEAPAETVAQIQEKFRQTDQPVPQVMLEAIICVVSPESGFRFGLDWGHAVRLNNQSLVDIGMQGLAFGAGISPGGAKDLFSDFAVTSAFVQVLAQEGYISIRAAPRVMSRDGEKAEISIARQTFFSVQPQNADVFFRQDIQEVEAGINLIISPTIRGDNVQVVIEKAEVSEDIRSSQNDPELVDNPFPLINRRRVTTTVDVKDGRTIVIGGLMQRQTVDRVSQVPGFRRIPKLGRMFEKVERQSQEAEVVIFISPKIVTQTDSRLEVDTHAERNP